MQPYEYQEFNRFIERLDDYLYERGFYTNGYYIKQKCKSYQDVEKYLTEHCYEPSESAEIVKKLREEIICILKTTE